ncbi:uncharacterized protein [Amphiura filiformis]|uniref:uncharacterized protein n=1 Tax=Amphiura filiformis TaxID=82378 RepID=UPI003B21CC44
MKTNISSVTCQLTEEREKNKILGEELQVSRELCMELNAIASHPSTNSEKYYYLHKTPRNVVVREVGLQVALGDHDYEISANGAKNMTSPDLTHSRTIHQKYDWPYTSSTHAPHLSKDDEKARARGGVEATEGGGGEEQEEGRLRVHVLHQQCREKEFQIQKLTEKLSKYLHRNAEMEAEQISRQENFGVVESKLICCNQEVSHLKEVVSNQQEDIALLEQIKENLHSRCSDLEKREQDLEELVDSLTEDMNGIAKEKKKLNRHIKELNSSLETKQIVISEKIEELEAQTNLLEVIKQVAFGSPSRKKLHTPRSVTTTPRNSPVVSTPRELTEQKDVTRNVHLAANHRHGATGTDRRQSSTKSQKVAATEGRSKGKSSEKIPSKQERKRVSRSLNYNDCAHPGDTTDDSDPDDADYNGGSDDDDDDVKPINGFYNNSYVSSSEDIRELASPTPNDGIQHAEPEHNIAASGGEQIPTDECASGDELDEEKFQQDFHGNQSSPKTKDEQSVDELIAEVLAELAEEEKCEADKQVIPKAAKKQMAPASKMESEGLLLRKHELENYAMRARDRSWQYMYVVQLGSQLCFYESKEDHLRGKTYNGEGPLDLTDASVYAASDYSRRKYVFRVSLASGQRFLFQARDDREMLFWICSMDSGAINTPNSDSDTFNGATPGIGVIAPPITGSPSKTDRLRNMIKGSISALTK